MKISNDVIETFRLICRGERNTPARDVKFKIIRNFNLGQVTKVYEADTYIKQFGDFCMLYNKGKIISIYHDKKAKPVKVSDYVKYTYNEEHGRSDLNVKYNR